MPLGQDTLLGHLQKSFAAVTRNPPIVLTTFAPSPAYEAAIRRACPTVEAVLPAAELQRPAGWLSTLRLAPHHRLETPSRRRRSTSRGLVTNLDSASRWVRHLVTLEATARRHPGVRPVRRDGPGLAHPALLRGRHLALRLGSHLLAGAGRLHPPRRQPALPLAPRSPHEPGEPGVAEPRLPRSPAATFDLSVEQAFLGLVRALRARPSPAALRPRPRAAPPSAQVASHRPPPRPGDHPGRMPSSKRAPRWPGPRSWAGALGSAERPRRPVRHRARHDRQGRRQPSATASWPKVELGGLDLSAAPAAQDSFAPSLGGPVAHPRSARRPPVLRSTRGSRPGSSRSSGSRCSCSCSPRCCSSWP